MCITQFGDQTEQIKQLEQLKKLKNFHRNVSEYEIKVASQQVIPTRQGHVELIDGKRKRIDTIKQGIDSLLMSSQSSEHGSRPSQPRSKEGNPKHYLDHDTNEDKALFTEILRKETSDFLKIDLGFSNNDKINSADTMLKLLKIFINWNKETPENAIHFYCGDILERQVAAARIQKWFRQALRVRRERQLILRQDEEMRLQRKSMLVQPVPNQLTILKCILLKRAATTIQKYWAMYRLRKRIQMLSNLKIYLSEVTESTLCIE